METLRTLRNKITLKLMSIPYNTKDIEELTKIKRYTEIIEMINEEIK
jgi:hypothetical protein